MRMRRKTEARVPAAAVARSPRNSRGLSVLTNALRNPPPSDSGAPNGEPEVVFHENR